MGSSKAPAPPDYIGAAKAQGESNLEAAIATGQINNPNVINPYGRQSVAWNGNIPTITQTLTPEQQILLNQETKGKQILGQTGINSANQVMSALGRGVDFSGAPAAPTSANQTRDDVVKAMMGRVDSDTAGQRDQKNSQLIAAGIRPGTSAYSDAMTQIDRQYNDARSNAILSGGQAAQQDYNMDMGSRQQAISELLAKRSVPLNEINALMTGAQVSSPFANGLGYQAGANVGAAPIAQGITNQGQAQQNIYNQNQATQNANIGAGAGLIGSLGSAAISR